MDGNIYSDHFRPKFCAASIVVAQPQKGSNTTLPCLNSPRLSSQVVRLAFTLHNPFNPACEFTGGISIITSCNDCPSDKYRLYSGTPRIPFFLIGKRIKPCSSRRSNLSWSPSEILYPLSLAVLADLWNRPVSSRALES